MPKAASKPVVGVFFGSRSAEHDVSIVTALGAVIKPLELMGTYNVLPVYIAKDGRWFCDPRLKEITLFTSGAIQQWLQRARPVSLSFRQGLWLQGAGRFDRPIKIDIAFPALHGTHGEDGEVTSLFELADVPYVGCGVAASAVAMDKVLTKQIAAAAGVAVTPSVHFSKADYEAAPAVWQARIKRELHYPLFVKPAHLGSSIGISRVAAPAELANAIEVALHYDDRALVEQAVPNLIEVTLPIIGNDTPQPALLERPLTSSDDFFDFDTKYMHGGKKGGAKSGGKAGAQGYSQIPAKLPAGLYKQAEATGLQVYRALGCSGLARVDMLIDSVSQTVYCNEVNPLPGSLYNHNWNQAGVSNVALVQRLIDLALERYDYRHQLATSFATNYLKQF